MRRCIMLMVAVTTAALALDARADTQPEPLEDPGPRSTVLPGMAGGCMGAAAGSLLGCPGVCLGCYLGHTLEEDSVADDPAVVAAKEAREEAMAAEYNRCVQMRNALPPDSPRTIDCKEPDGGSLTEALVGWSGAAAAGLILVGALAGGLLMVVSGLVVLLALLPTNPQVGQAVLLLGSLGFVGVMLTGIALANVVGVLGWMPWVAQWMKTQGPWN